MSLIAMRATSPVVQKVRRNPCGLIWWLIPAAWATRTRARLAPARSIRRPVRVRRIGPLARPPIASRTARSTGIGSGMSAGLAPFPDHVQQLVAGLIADVGDVGVARLGHAQAEHTEHADQGVVVRTRRPGGAQQRGELQGVQDGSLLTLPGDLGPGDGVGGV